MFKNRSEKWMSRSVYHQCFCPDSSLRIFCLNGAKFCMPFFCFSKLNKNLAIICEHAQGQPSEHFSSGSPSRYRYGNWRLNSRSWDNCRPDPDGKTSNPARSAWTSQNRTGHVCQTKNTADLSSKTSCVSDLWLSLYQVKLKLFLVQEKKPYEQFSEFLKDYYFF